MQIIWPKACVACGRGDEQTPLTRHRYPFKHSQMIGGEPSLHLCPPCYSRARKRYITGAVSLFLIFAIALPLTLLFYTVTVQWQTILGLYLTELEYQLSTLSFLNQQATISNGLYWGCLGIALLFLGLWIRWITGKRHLAKQSLKMKVDKLEKSLSDLKPLRPQFTKFPTKVKLYSYTEEDVAYELDVSAAYAQIFLSANPAWKECT